MEVREFQEGDLKSLYLCWSKIGEKIPYFFPVSLERWLDCLLEDKLDGEQMFLSHVIYVAVENGEITGFIQCIQPTFAWNEEGEKLLNPQIGIVRHFYFDPGRDEVAKRLFDQSAHFINQFDNQHAFYHIFGMSCNAHHGKLHETLSHVELFLKGRGFKLEHENLYYYLKLKEKRDQGKSDLKIVLKPSSVGSIQEYEIFIGEDQIGGLQIRLLDKLSGGMTKDTVYLTWIGIKEGYRGQGWGTRSIQLLADRWLSCGIKYLHTDTASDNLGARKLYERLGFQNGGKTRSYFKPSY